LTIDSRQGGRATVKAGLLALTVLTLAPASSPGATAIGSNLAREPEFSLTGNRAAYYMDAALPSTRAAGGVASPLDGVVVRVHVRVGAIGACAYPKGHQFVVMENLTSSTARRVAVGEPVTVPYVNDTLSYDTRLPIRSGQFLGIQATQGHTCAPAIFRNTASSRTKAVFVTTDGPDESGQNVFPADGRETLLQATVEPDIDGDGFGDESQDACPANPLTAGPCPPQGLGTEPGTQTGGAGPIDSTPPRLTNVSVDPGEFAVDPKGKPAGSAVRKGTRIRYTLSEQAAVFLTVERARPGRRSGGRCRKQTAGNRARRKCTRYVKAGSYSELGRAGRNASRFSGLIGGKRLSPGKYRLQVRAIDAAGNLSSRRSAKFTIVKARK
jgi:hypothetical protein